MGATPRRSKAAAASEQAGGARPGDAGMQAGCSAEGMSLFGVSSAAPPRLLCNAVHSYEHGPGHCVRHVERLCLQKLSRPVVAAVAAQAVAATESRSVWQAGSSIPSAKLAFWLRVNASLSQPWFQCMPSCQQGLDGKQSRGRSSAAADLAAASTSGYCARLQRVPRVQQRSISRSRHGIRCAPTAAAPQTTARAPALASRRAACQ